FEAERELAGIWSTAVLSPDGQTVYFGANAGGVYALETATGKKRWQAPLYGTIYAATELDREGRLYVATTSGHVIALEAASGRQLWDWSANGQPAATSIWTAPAILPDGRLVVADRDGLVYLLADTAAAPAAAAAQAPPSGALPRSGQPLTLLLLTAATATALGAVLRRR
ncbi:MAG TPA: PQQ-binding-like beta-propeller repeat protein, partial [Chloroflexota bacterium]